MYSARCLSPILTNSGISRQIVVDVSNTKFYENPFSRNGEDACGETDRPTDRPTDITMLIGAFRCL